MAHQEWRAELARVRERSLRLKVAVVSRSLSDVAPLVEALLGATRETDPVLEYFVLQGVHDALVQVDNQGTLEHCVGLVLLDTHSCTVGGQMRLLRHLLKRHEGRSGSQRASEDENHENNLDAVDDINPRTLMTKCFLGKIPELEKLLTLSFRCQNQHHAVHDAIQFLSSLIKCSLGFANDSHALAHVVFNLLAIASETLLSQCSVPTYLASDLVSLLKDTKQLLDNPSGGTNWLHLDTWTIATINFLSTPAFESCYNALLGDTTSPCTSTHGFVEDSSIYPLLQQWIHLWCMVTSTMWSSKIAPPDWLCDANPRMPSRSRLLRLLAEQDDILVGVAVELFRISEVIRRDELSSGPRFLRNYILQKLHPDQVFSDLLLAFGDDHLVLLDLLTSCETQTLDYLMRYLRFAVAMYPRSRDTWDSDQRAGIVVSVLIRLRFEIQRQAEANTFPYNPAPLLRRLEAFEQLYDNEDLS